MTTVTKKSCSFLMVLVVEMAMHKTKFVGSVVALRTPSNSVKKKNTQFLGHLTVQGRKRRECMVYVWHMLQINYQISVP